MDMEYIKRGQIFNATGNYDWMDTYANPVTCVEMEDRIRAYFTTRSKQDANGNFTSYVTFLDCDKQDPSKILYIHDKPLLEMGLPGTFDEHGTMVAAALIHEGKFYLYWMGWQRSTVVPYIISIGLATSDDGVNFTRVSDGPVIGLNRFSPFGIGNITIVIEDGIFHMWYTHYNQWIDTKIGFRPTYDIRYASSTNGMDWQFDERVCIAPVDENEALATPAVMKINGQYHMWYAYRPGVDAEGRSGKYVIGHAVSENKFDWTRMDAAVGLKVSESGWDSEMICSPKLLQTAAHLFLFYCGNHYGRDGFGFAEVVNY